MDKNKSVKKIVNAPLFARTFGALIDLALTVLIGAGLFLGVSKIAENLSFAKAYKDDYNQNIVLSGLMKETNDGLVPYELNNYLDYQNKFYDFYHGYYEEQTKKDPSLYFDEYWFNVFIYGQNDGLNRYEEKELEKRPALVRNVGPTLFTYKLNSANEPLYNEFALPIESENGTVDISMTTKAKLRNYFYVNDEDVEGNEIASRYLYIYYYALADLTSLSKLQNDYSRYALFTGTIPLAIAVFLTFGVFFFIIPLCFKNGETLGKKIMHTCLVNKLGYQYSRLQLIPRFLFPTFLIVTVVLVLGFSIWSLAAVSFGLLISYLFVIFSKDNKALHDYFAGTLVIDTRESTWFKDINEEEKMQKEVDDYVEAVKNNVDPDNRENIIYTNPHFKDRK